MTKLDKDTVAVLSEGEIIKNLVEGDGWKMVKEKLVNKMLDLQSVLNLDPTDANELVIDIKARKTAIEILKEWLAEVEGQLDQYETNKPLIDDYVMRG